MTILLGIFALLLPGCAEIPSWVPFQGQKSDSLPGVITPAQKISQLKKLTAKAAESDLQTKHLVARQLVGAIRTEADPLIRAEIIRTLGEYPDPCAEGILKAALSDPDSDVRIAACDALSKHGDAQAAELLASVLSGDVNQDVRLAAARALGKTKQQRAIVALGEALVDSDPAMQYRAVLSLKEITGQDLGNNVDRWRQYVQQEHPLPEKPTSLAEKAKKLF